MKIDSELKVFISHHHNDAKALTNLKEELKHYGINCFLAHEDIHPGEHDLLRIEQELRACDFFLLIGTDESRKSPFVNQEIGFAYALKDKKRIISTFQHDCSTWGFIERQQAVKFREIEEEPFCKKIIHCIAKDAHENTYLYNKQSSLNVLGVDGFIKNEPKQNKLENKLTLTVTGHDDYGFKTSCSLTDSKKQTTLATLNIAHCDFPDCKEFKRLKNWAKTKNNITDFLNDDFTFLSKKFFSCIQFEDEITEENKQAIRCLFNDIESCQELKDLYGKKTVVEASFKYIEHIGSK